MTHELMITLIYVALSFYLTGGTDIISLISNWYSHLVVLQTGYMEYNRIPLTSWNTERTRTLGSVTDSYRCRCVG